MLSLRHMPAVRADNSAPVKTPSAPSRVRNSLTKLEMAFTPAPDSRQDAYPPM
jgi:hypothetical protein